MTIRKERMTVTVDPDLVVAGNRAVAAGHAESLSGWVNAALIEATARDARLEALASAVRDHEAEFGEITDAEIAALRRADRQAASIVRGRHRGPGAA